MANASINVLSDGSLGNVTTISGKTETLEVARTQVGRYEVHGTLGMVPPPYGWGIVVNPVDRITARVSYLEDVLLLETKDTHGEPADIQSMVTLHIVLEDRVQPTVPPPSEKDLLQLARAEYARLRLIADEAIQHLQDLIDIGEGTGDTVTLLLDHKRYRVALNKVVEQPAYPLVIDWPLVPVTATPLRFTTAQGADGEPAEV
ncbi:tail fiber assembly protein [Pseudomonas sp. NPDC087358]|uniref:tail fiber assembly protein n=1 Tax=Pseudomonas sp. NPDC087358 TaxID=3364439 RepID=UPI0038517775